MKTHDPPRAGLRFQCPQCKARAWIPTSRLQRMNDTIAFPHHRDCKAPNKHIRATKIVDITGSPLVTAWQEEPA